MHAKTMKSVARALSVCFVLIFSTGACGCALLGGEEDSDGGAVSNTPRKQDSVTMRNGDVIKGTVDIETIVLVTSYLPPMRMKKADIDTIEFFGKDQQVKVRTKHGDTMRGTISDEKFRLSESSLPESPVLARNDIKQIRLR